MQPWGRRAVLTAAAAGVAAGCSPSGSRATLADPSGTAPVPPSGAGPDWAALQRSTRGGVLRPGRPAYDRARLLENPRFDDQRPLALVRARQPSDVSAAIRFAREYDLPLAVRSGGHSYTGASAGGRPRSVVIDLRGLNQIHVQGTRATVGAGVPLVDLYRALGAAGRALPAGSCPTVGVAGLTLGGGVGVLTRSLGLTCDHVTALYAFTPEGRRVRASAQEEPDLFWALRGGGGGQLAVVTGFEFATVAAPTLSTFYLQWPIAQAERVLGAWWQWAPAADDRLWSTCKVLAGSVRGSGPVVLVSGTWTGPESSLAGQLDGFLASAGRAAVDSRTRRSYLTAMLAYAGCSDTAPDACQTGAGGALEREVFAATSHVAYAAPGAAAIHTLVDGVAALQQSGLREAGVSLDALGGAVADLAPADTAFVHRAALATVQYTATYESGPPGPALRAVRGLRAAMEPTWGNTGYVNYLDSAVRNPMTAYFGANRTRLRQVGDTYDPDGVLGRPGR